MSGLKGGREFKGRKSGTKKNADLTCQKYFIEKEKSAEKYIAKDEQTEGTLRTRKGAMLG